MGARAARGRRDRPAPAAEPSPGVYGAQKRVVLAQLSRPSLAAWLEDDFEEHRADSFPAKGGDAAAAESSEAARRTDGSEARRTDGSEESFEYDYDTTPLASPELVRTNSKFV